MTLTLLTVTILGLSSDCLNVINFAIGMNMDKVRPNYFTLLKNYDCCSYYQGEFNKITCDGSARVIEIWLSVLGLNGTLNGTSLPNSLEALHIYDNQLTGNLPSKWPARLINLDINGNKLGGDLPSFPDSLQYIYFGANGYKGCHFTGTLKLNRPVELYIVENWISDIQITDDSNLQKERCDISYNPLLGNSNVMNSKLSRCTQIGLYDARLLPNTFYTTVFKSSSKVSSVRSTLISKSIFPSSQFTMFTTKSSVDRIFTAFSTKRPHSIDSESSWNQDRETLESSDEATNFVSFYDAYSTTLVYTSFMSNIVDQKTDAQQDLNTSLELIYVLIGCLAALCILVLIASLVFKHPKLHSKYGRKNSFGTLNTVSTTK